MYILYVSHVTPANKNENITIHTLSSTGVDMVSVFPLASDAQTGKIRALSRVISILSDVADESITVYVNDKELSESATALLRGDTPSLLDTSVWNEFMTTILNQNIRLSNIKVADRGGLTDLEQKAAEDRAA